MQAQLDTTDTGMEIRILGINKAGEESGNADMVAGRTIPWLQDTENVDVWGAWDVTWRDVVVLDDRNEVVAIYNLTEHNLALPAQFDSLKSILLRAAD